MIADSTRIHEEGIEYLKMHLFGTDEQINQYTVSITGLEEKTEVIKADVANFHEQYERESKDFQQRVTKSMVSTAMHLQTHDEQIATHSNIISGTPVSSRSYSAPRTPNHSSNESRFSYRDRYQQTPTQDYKKPENSKTKSEDFKKHEYRKTDFKKPNNDTTKGGKPFDMKLAGAENGEQMPEKSGDSAKTPNEVPKDDAPAENIKGEE
ncbi:hypothetical protein U1Q18_051155 [Sarracenia purpurea var. burkii]